MHPQQPYGHQQVPPAIPHGQPQPGYPQQYQQGRTVPAVEQPSGITAIVAAVLGILIGLAWIVLIATVVVNVGSDDVRSVLSASGFAAVLGTPPIAGSIGLFARRRFGRRLLIAGLALSMLPSAFLVVAALATPSAPPEPLLFGTPVLVFSMAGIVLASLPTTGRHLAAAQALRTAGQVHLHSRQPVYGHPQQYPPQYPQPMYGQQPQQYPHPAYGRQPAAPRQDHPPQPGVHHHYRG